MKTKKETIAILEDLKGANLEGSYKIGKFGYYSIAY